MQDPPYPPYQSQYPQPQYRPIGFVCPFCHTNAPPMKYVKVSTGGWIVFVLLILSCFGILLAWIGLLMKESYTVCSQCGIKLG
jgi:LITAF-like zinc ribbon domain